MKKYLLIKYFIYISMSIIIPCKVYGFDITAGATSWYAWGEQFYMQKNYNSLVKSDPAFLYGPALSVKFNDDFNLTFVYLYGKFDAVKDDGLSQSKSNFKRIDSDLVLNYKLNNYLKIFMGVKYLAYDIVPSSNQYKVIKIDPHTSYGGGLGLNATIPITGNIFGFATLSGLYLWGKDKLETTLGGFYASEKSTISYNEYGINSNISIAYYIAQASTVISLGGRYQYIFANYKNNDIGLSEIRFTMYGVTLTATYTFNL